MTVFHPTPAQKSSPGLFASLRQGDWNAVTEAALDLVFPPRCTGCGRVGWRWCDHCRDDLRNVPAASIKTVAFDRLPTLSTGYHQDCLQSAVHALKYDSAHDVAALLAERLQDALSTTDWQPDVAIPVPMHADRLAERGYNQAQRLTQALGELIDLPTQDDLLVRTRATRTQVGLDREERLQNVSGAFALHPSADIHGKTILIVDDVLTTGATLVGCADTLLKAGAGPVYGLTVTVALS